MLFKRILDEAKAFQPDWIIGCSDAWYGWLAQKISMKIGTRLAIDAYDNYEAYMPWNLPLHLAWRRAVASAEVVTAAGPQLAVHLDRHRPDKAPTALVPMAADSGFRPRDRQASRKSLGLPMDTFLVGYMGGWSANRGTDILIDAFRIAKARRREIRLVVTGRPPRAVQGEQGVIALGYIPDASLPIVVSAMDLSTVITADSSFGRFSYPAKLCEAMACGVPVAATDTEPVRWMLRGDKRFLVPLGDPDALATRIVERLDHPTPCPYGELPSWESSARAFECALLDGARG